MNSLTFDVLFYIASLLDLATLQAWRTTCTAADKAAAAFLVGRYHRLLKHHFADVSGFRSLLRMTGAVISGSAALYTLDSERAHGWRPKDIDIYVSLEYAGRVAAYLTEVENYVHSWTHKSRSRYTRDSAGFTEVVHFENVDGMQIDLIKSSTHSALYPIPYFWSTHVMNYLTADSFCVAYPTLTLHGRGLMNPVALVDMQYPHARTLSVIEKYQQRGYDFRLYGHAWDADPEVECAQERDPGCPRTIRYFGDPHCLTGTFSDTRQAARFALSRAQPNTKLLVRWWRGGHACGGGCVHPSTFNSMRRYPHVTTHRVTSGYFESFLGGQPVRDAIPGPIKAKF